MMSDAWDIIHGPNRDNARTNANSSLQGRLDSFKEIKENQIPVKRALDGTLVGSKINNALKYDNWDDKPEEILEDDGITPEFVRDDAWIETAIDTSGLAGGIKDGDLVDQSNNSGISIHHTFHKTEDSVTSIDKNVNNSFTASNTYKETYLRSSNKNHGTNDKIDLYVPYVDAKGHVVGQNIETVTLPYGFKTIKTNGRSDEVAENATGTPVTADVVADTTQDTLEINSGNKWIRIDTNATGDSLTIRHDVHETSSDEATTDWTQTEADTTIPVVTYGYDEAGHYIEHHTENYKLPFGYGKIKGDNGSTAATATYDELTFTSDEWLTATVDQDKVTYSHDYPKKVNDTKSESDVNGNGDTIVLETLTRDEKGHVTSVNQNTVTLPFGYKTITIGNESTSTSDVGAAAGSVVADNTQDTLAINPGNKWIHIGASDTNNDDIITLSHEVNPITTTAKTDTDLNNGTDTITIQDTQYDSAGHVTHNQSHTYTLPYGYKTFTGDSGSSSADNTQDSMSVTGDSWVKTTVTNDKIAFAHIGPVEGSKTANTESKL
jgi:hypothetical protein